MHIIRLIEGLVIEIINPNLTTRLKLHLNISGYWSGSSMFVSKG